MRIGILTFTENTNIGQRLQNYALQQVLEGYGYSVETIKQGYPFNYIKKMIKDSINVLKHPVIFVRKQKRKRKFDTFNEDNIHFYHKVMPFHGDNSNFAKDFDLFIVGSDQVWSPDSPHVGDNYFLSFADKSQRLTYAPSLSVERISESKREKYRKYMEGFVTITVREDRGADLIEELTGNRPEVVLDPTLLIERAEWDKIKKPCRLIPEKSYMVSLFLGDSQKGEIVEYANQNQLSIVELNDLTCISPAEFLSLIEKASLVVTDSYHVTIFSIIYHVPFINFTRSNGEQMNSRFETLYRFLGITNRNWNYLENNHEEIYNLDFDKIEENRKNAEVYSRGILKQELNMQ